MYIYGWSNFGASGKVYGNDTNINNLCIYDTTIMENNSISGSVIVNDDVELVRDININGDITISGNVKIKG